MGLIAPHIGRFLWILHAVAWTCDWLFWVFVNRNHHPNLAVNAIATAILVGCCACAVYVDSLLIQPRVRRGRYVIALLSAMAVFTAIAVIGIQLAYDVMWGPDTARYGLGFNFATDFVGVALHVAAAKGLVRMFRRFSGAR